MSAANNSFSEFLSMAVSCGCRGIELRNDLKAPLFNGMSASEAGDLAVEHGLRIHALAEVQAFNLCAESTVTQARTLARIARQCGAEGIALIPAVDGSRPSMSQRKFMLVNALNVLAPVLEEYGVCGFIEPIGFGYSTLRYKAEVVDAIESISANSLFKLVHDTFHHHLAAESEFFAEHTGIVHVSGVVTNNLTADGMEDRHRVLVDANDRLGNLQQMRSLVRLGYQGPVSMEVFAPEVHNLPNLAESLRDSFHFINSGLAAAVA